jgi:hypothetical protein
LVKLLEQRALRARVAQLRLRINLLIDRQPASHTAARERRAKLYERPIGRNLGPIHCDHQQLHPVAPPAQQCCPNGSGFLSDAPIAHQPIHALERTLVGAPTHHPTRQPRQAQQVSAHHRSHRRAKQLAPRCVNLI